MRRDPHTALSALALSLSACLAASGPSEVAPARSTPPPNGTCWPCDGPPLPESTHPLDLALAPILRARCASIEKAEPHALCRRLFADVLGRYPSLDDVETTCRGRSIDAIITDLQARPEYLLASERYWRRRFGFYVGDFDWRASKDLFALVDALHRSKIGYDEFAIRALMHPAVVEIAGAAVALETFLGRSSEDSEFIDLDRLFQIYDVASYTFPDFPQLPDRRGYVDPSRCDAIGGCTTTLFGGASIDVPHDGPGQRTWIDEVPPEVVSELRKPGALIRAQPAFWEAAADSLLDRYLDWDDGARTPRTPGVLVPNVRQALADALQRNPDFRAAERLVLTSWLYTARTSAPAGRSSIVVEQPVFAVGPLKRATPEVFLDSALHWSNGDLGTCDPRYVTNSPYYTLSDPYFGVAPSRLREAIDRLHALQENRAPIEVTPRGDLVPGYRYQKLALEIGACSSGFRVEGITLGLHHEALVTELCTQYLKPPNRRLAGAGLALIVKHHMNDLLGRDPAPEEMRAFEEAYDPLIAKRMKGGELYRSICVAILGSAEMLFY
jgi:hypothetical protein